MLPATRYRPFTAHILLSAFGRPFAILLFIKRYSLLSSNAICYPLPSVHCTHPAIGLLPLPCYFAISSNAISRSSNAICYLLLAVRRAHPAIGILPPFC